MYRCIDKALEFGALNALDDNKRSGRPAQITDDAKTWVVSLACQKPKELGYSYEVWTTRLLSQHIRKNAEGAGHPSVKNIGSGTVSRILDENDIKPHKINYYLERRDPDFDTKMAQVLHVYQQVEWTLEDNEFQPVFDVMLSYDEKTGIRPLKTRHLIYRQFPESTLPLDVTPNTLDMEPLAWLLELIWSPVKLLALLKTDIAAVNLWTS
ncbi:hypothetical protein GCM10009001_29060 [Virgibacillus siamensis]|uniref:Uncharacterized protein n=1 Tax=Virgibacillus siamensis TaxID=480071 RepID=A0ABP3RG31_9BACI